MVSASGTQDMNLQREEQFFEFHPGRFVDDIANATTDYMADCMDEVEGVLLEDDKVRSLDVSGVEVSAGCDKAYTSLKKVFDKNFDKFELYVLRNVFKIPDEVDLMLPVSTVDHVQEDQVTEAMRQSESLLGVLSALKTETQTLEEEEVALDTQLKVSAQLQAQFQCVGHALEREDIVDLASTMQKVVDSTREVRLQTEQLERLTGNVVDKENSLDPIQRIGTEYSTLQRAFRGASVETMQGLRERVSLVR